MLEPSKQNKNIFLLVVAAVVAIAAAVIIAVMLTRNGENGDARDATSYVGLTLDEAHKKAEDGGVAYHTYLESDRNLVGGQDANGLLLYVDSMGKDGKVVGAELRSPQPEAEQPGIDKSDERTEVYVGMAEAEAAELAEDEGLEVRVVMRDGESLPITADFKQDRINFSIFGGKVTEAELY